LKTEKKKDHEERWTKPARATLERLLETAEKGRRKTHKASTG